MKNISPACNILTCQNNYSFQNKSFLFKTPLITSPILVGNVVVVKGKRIGEEWRITGRVFPLSPTLMKIEAIVDKNIPQPIARNPDIIKKKIPN